MGITINAETVGDAALKLGSATGSIYRFVPHNGLTKCASLEEAMS